VNVTIFTSKAEINVFFKVFLMEWLQRQLSSGVKIKKKHVDFRLLGN